jgi:hypothetical protein
MKKLKRLAIKKVTLRDLDDPALDAIAGGTTGDTCNFPATCECYTRIRTCKTCNTNVSCDGTCFGTQCI